MLHPTTFSAEKQTNVAKPNPNVATDILSVELPTATADETSAATDYEIMRHPVTVGRNVRRPEDITVRDISYIMDAIQTGFYEGYNLKGAVEALRNMTDKNAQRNAKSTLPWFCGSLCKGKRANALVKQASFMIFDIDHVANTEELKAMAMEKFPWLRYAFASPTDGLKLIAQIDTPIISEHVFRRIYIYLALQIEWALKHICDTTPDWSRACFMSYDPVMLRNAKCQPLDQHKTYRQALEVAKLKWPVEGAESMESRSHLHEASRSHLHPIPITEQSPNYSGAKDSCEHPHDCTHESLLPNKLETTSKLSTAAMTPVHREDTSTGVDDYAKATQIVSVLAQIPIVYKDWVKMGQALYAGFGERGKALWDMFLGNPNYKDSQVMMDAHWRSFRSTHSVTLASLFYLAEKYGVN